MVGFYIIVGLFMVGILTLIAFKIKSMMADRVVARARAEKNEEDRSKE